MKNIIDSLYIRVEFSEGAKNGNASLEAYYILFGVSA